VRPEHKVGSELSFIRGIAENLYRDFATMEAGLTKAQQTHRIAEQLSQMRERVKVIVQCVDDGEQALTVLQDPAP